MGLWGSLRGFGPLRPASCVSAARAYRLGTGGAARPSRARRGLLTFWAALGAGGLSACNLDWEKPDPSLPPPDPDHPLRAGPRGALRIAGSWSVRLGPGGFNVAHCHPLGWLSSAFYVAVPDAGVMGEGTAGHFHWGAPPAELGLDLPPRGTIAPQPGMLVLFPSTKWLGTFPIAAGERLNIAFDIGPA